MAVKKTETVAAVAAPVPAAVKKPFKLMTSKEMDDAYSLLTKSQGELNDLIQRLAINAIGYSVKHGDIRPANRLVERFDGGLRKQSVVTYMEVHGNLEWHTEPGKTPSFIFHRKEGKEFQPETLMELLWYKARGEAPIQSIYDVEEQVGKMIKAIQARIGRGKQIKNVSLATYIQDAFDQWHQAQATLKAENAKVEKTLTPAEQANIAQATDVASEVEAQEKVHAPARRVSDRVAAHH